MMTHRMRSCACSRVELHEIASSWFFSLSVPRNSPAILAQGWVCFSSQREPFLVSHHFEWSTTRSARPWVETTALSAGALG